MKKLIGVIAAGGRGYRLGNTYKYTQKCLLEIEKNKPIINYIIQFFLKIGCKKIYVIGGYKYNDILKYIQSLDNSNIHSFHGRAIGTAKALLKMKNIISESFLYSSGDILFKPELLNLLINIHKDKDIATIAVSSKILAPTHPRVKLNFHNEDPIITDMEFVQNRKICRYEYCTMELGFFSPKIFSYLERVKKKDIISRALFYSIKDGCTINAVLNLDNWYHITFESDYFFMKKNISSIKELIKYDDESRK